MKSKKMILLILGMLILVLVLGVYLIQSGKVDSDKTNAAKASYDVSDEKNLMDEDESAGDDITISSVVTAISLSYPDFELQEILTATKSGLDEMEQSEGVYVKFNSGGETIIIHSKPLVTERTEKGTIDLHEQKLGFATFDTVTANTLKGKELTAIDVNALSELITESLLVSLYEHY